MKFRISRWLYFTVAISALIPSLLAIFIWYDERNMVANILNIPSIPFSVSVTDCESWGWTDVLTTCAIEVSPVDFHKLLLGYSYAESEMFESSYDIGGGPKVGKEFSVAVEYYVMPKEFPHGGHVRIAADKERKNAIVDIYIE